MYNLAENYLTVKVTIESGGRVVVIVPFLILALEKGAMFTSLGWSKSL